MKSNWIERYVYDVTRRLGEAERAEVERELTANIRDMLPDEPTEDDVKAVLTELGNPAQMAEKYRQKPRYLISPKSYDLYMRTLKLVLPIVGIVLLCIGLVTGYLVGARSAVSVGDILIETISTGFSMAFEGALQALFWITLGFCISDRVGTGTGKHAWRLQDLPRDIPRAKHTIPLADGIVELVLTIVFAFAGALVCSGRVPFVFSLSRLSVRETPLFSGDFLAACMPLVITFGVLGVIAAILKLVFRAWNVPVCCAVALSDLGCAAAALYALFQPVILSEETIRLLAEKSIQFVQAGAGGMSAARIAFIVLICALAVFGAARAIVRTIKALKAQ